MSVKREIDVYKIGDDFFTLRIRYCKGNKVLKGFEVYFSSAELMVIYDKIIEVLGTN